MSLPGDALSDASPSASNDSTEGRTSRQPQNTTETRQREPRARPGRSPRATGLQTAAASLEAAFARLEQVRASLVQLSDSLADPPLQASPRTPLGPNHDSILLAGAMDELAVEPATATELEEQADAVVSGFQDSFRRAVQAQNSLTRLVEQTAALRHSQTANAPIANQGIRLRTLLRAVNNHQAPDLSGDDGITLRGRRVASRTPAMVNTLHPTLPAIRSNSGTMDAGTGRESSTPVPQTQQYHLDRAMVGQALQGMQLSAQQQEQAQVTRTRGSALAASDLPLRRRPERNEARPTPESATPMRGHAFYRPASLVNAVNNVSSPSPSSLSEQPSLIFDDLAAAEQSIGFEPDTVLVDGRPWPTRGYAIHRRLDANGREVVQNLDLDWLTIDGEGSVGEVNRRRMLNNFQERTQITVPISTGPPPNSGGSRQLHRANHVGARRGWARLDADGNEISTEEEEELERHRTEFRLLAQARAQGLVGPVRGSVLSSMQTAAPRRPRAKVSDELADFPPFEVDPLPMPLSKMMPTHIRAQEKEIVIPVPFHCSFAGR